MASARRRADEGARRGRRRPDSAAEQVAMNTVCIETSTSARDRPTARSPGGPIHRPTAATRSTTSEVHGRRASRRSSIASKARRRPAMTPRITAQWRRPEQHQAAPTARACRCRGSAAAVRRGSAGAPRRIAHAIVRWLDGFAIRSPRRVNRARRACRPSDALPASALGCRPGNVRCNPPGPDADDPRTTALHRRSSHQARHGRASSAAAGCGGTAAPTGRAGWCARRR